MSHSSSTHHSNCQDCGAPLTGPYCAQCGQHDVDYRGSAGHILEDAVEGALHFDGKFLKSARLLFSRPGFLTNEFIAGRRTRYTHPVRFYVFASFLFFFFTFVTGHRAPAGPQAPAPAAQAGTLKVRTQSLGKNESWLENPIRIQVDSSDGVSEGELSKEFWHLLPEGQGSVARFSAQS